ncbi:MAG: menaquinone biosynthesis protein [Planctomycetota bacterium]|nr:menaquinone biosynthesis protein [Planctomycetota bacterium]
MKIRVGAIDFLNALPLCDKLSQTDDRWEIIEALPSELARALRSKEIDVGLVPQVEACTDPGYRIIPGHCISCDGEVGSILLFCRKEWKDIEVVAVDQASSSSVALLQVLRHLDGLPAMELMETRSDLFLFEKPDPPDAILLIGDAALRHRSSPLERVDLGQAWKDRTGLPFVFAVWLAREDLPSWVLARIFESAEEGLASRNQIATDFSQRHPDVFDDAAATDYLNRCICYHLGEKQKEALVSFHRHRAEIDPELDREWCPQYLEVDR